MDSYIPTYILYSPGSQRKDRILDSIENNVTLPLKINMHPGIFLTDESQMQMYEYEDLEGYNNKSKRMAPNYVRAVVGSKRAHRQMFYKAAEEQTDWVLCMEDDVAITPAINEAIEKAMTAPDDIGFVTFYRSNHYKVNTTPVNPGNIEVFTGKDFLRGFVCFLARPSFLKRMADDLEKYGMECDILLTDYMQAGEKLWLIEAVGTGAERSFIGGYEA